MLLRHHWTDPFAYLGMHADENGVVVRASLPQARRAWVRRRGATRAHEMRPLDGHGLFEARIGRRKPFDYVIELQAGDEIEAIEDPYRFGPLLGDVDAYLIAEGTHVRLWNVLGARCRSVDGIAGTSFAVWAPNARRVSVVGDFNAWDGRRHPMRKRVECGVWELFVPGVEQGARYKYEIEGASGGLLPLKADPLARYAELRPDAASIVWKGAPPAWSDAALDARAGRAAAPRRADLDLRSPSRLVAARRGRPSSDVPASSRTNCCRTCATWVSRTSSCCRSPSTRSTVRGDTSQRDCSRRRAATARPTIFAPSSIARTRWSLGVIVDWVPGHFPNDPHGLAFFDGTHLYEHGDPRQGFHPDWNTLIYNLGRREVANFLIASALYWLEEFHVDALRVDAVASMLYLDYSRRPGEWIPNAHGGNENLEAIAFLRRLNETVFGRHDGATTIAEESTAWPMVTRPVEAGGLGFGYKWNMGWMHDTLRYFAHDPMYRRYHQNDVTFALVYAFSENYVLPLSHDEVVHGKRSLLGKMPGDRWQRFANLRALFALMFAHPGKKLLFMGAEFGASLEWNHDSQLDWDLPPTRCTQGSGVSCGTATSSTVTQPALHRLDADPAGFDWIDFQDAAASVLAFARLAGDRGEATASW